MKTHTLVESGAHKWLMLGRDPDRPGNVADTNEVVICFDKYTVLVDPGGIEIFPSFLEALTESTTIDSISNIVISMADADAASSLPLWRQVCTNGLTVSVPALTLDQLAHLDAECQLQPIGEDGGTINISNGFSLELIPAHHMHAPSAYSIYDPQLRVLYSGSVASAVNTANASGEFIVESFTNHLAFLEPYHERWFASTRAREAWIRKVRKLDIEYIVPHRGPALKGERAHRFLDWFETADLGGVLPQIEFDSAPTSPEPEVGSTGSEVEDLLAEFAPGVKPDSDFENDALNADSDSVLDEAFSELMDAPAPKQTGDPEPGGEYRLVTRSDFDGLVCAVLLEDLEMIDDILFVHPNDMQEGRVDIDDNDITTNLPYVPGCHIAFDHHLSEIARLGRKYDNHIIDPDAPSAARVVYEYYGGKDGFPGISEEMMAAVDQGDSAAYEMDDVLNPRRWALLNFIMDSRTGLGRYKGFRIPNYELMMSLIEYCSEYTIDEILELDDVKERVDFYFEHEPKFKEQIQRCTTAEGNLAVIDLLNEEHLYVGNRFMVYALFPDCNISMHCMWGRDRQNVVYAVGKSIFDKTSQTNVGELMLQYGGGGHHAAGTCQADPLLAPTVKSALIQQITQDG